MISDQLLTRATTAQKRVSLATAEPILSSMGKYGNFPSSDSSVVNTAWNFAAVNAVLAFGTRREFQVPAVRLLHPVGSGQFNPHLIDGNLVLLERLFDHFPEAIFIVPDGLFDLRRLVVDQFRHGRGERQSCLNGGCEVDPAAVESTLVSGCSSASVFVLRLRPGFGSLPLSPPSSASGFTSGLASGFASGLAAGFASAFGSGLASAFGSGFAAVVRLRGVSLGEQDGFVAGHRHEAQRRQIDCDCFASLLRAVLRRSTEWESAA